MQVEKVRSSALGGPIHGLPVQGLQLKALAMQRREEKHSIKKS